MKSLAIISICLLAVTALADTAIEQAQAALKEQGYYYGEINGQKNADTSAAIRRFQIRNGLQVTGELNDETLHALHSAPTANQTATPAPQTADAHGTTPQPQTLSSPIPHTTAAPVDTLSHTPFEMAPPELQRRVIVGAQTILHRRGLYKGEIDGIPGPEFEFSLRAFQAAIRLPPSGRLDMETLSALGLLPGQHGPAFGPMPPRRNYPSQFSQPPVRGEWIREHERQREEDDDDRD